MNALTEKLLEELQDREYREGYDEAFLDHVIASQIRVIREQRDLTQKQLADAAGMKQSRISAMEDEDYGSWSVNTLRRIAYALGVRLRVELAEWSTLLQDIERAGRKNLQRRSFDDDPQTRTRWPTSRSARQSSWRPTMRNFCGMCGVPIVPTRYTDGVKRWRHMYIDRDHVPYPADEWSPTGLVRLAAAAMASNPNPIEQQRDVAIAAVLAELRKEVSDLRDERDRLAALVSDIKEAVEEGTLRFQLLAGERVRDLIAAYEKENPHA